MSPPGDSSLRTFRCFGKLLFGDRQTSHELVKSSITLEDTTRGRNVEENTQLTKTLMMEIIGIFPKSRRFLNYVCFYDPPRQLMLSCYQLKQLRRQLAENHFTGKELGKTSCMKNRLLRECSRPTSEIDLLSVRYFRTKKISIVLTARLVYNLRCFEILATLLCVSFC